MIDALIQENQRLAEQLDSRDETLQELKAQLEAEKILRYRAEYDLSVVRLEMLTLEQALVETAARLTNLRSAVRS